MRDIKPQAHSKHHRCGRGAPPRRHENADCSAVFFIYMPAPRQGFLEGMIYWPDIELRGRVS